MASMSLTSPPSPTQADACQRWGMWHVLDQCVPQRPSSHHTKTHISNTLPPLQTDFHRVNAKYVLMKIITTISTKQKSLVELTA